MWIVLTENKQKHTSKKRATISTQLLEIIHTDISGPYDVLYFGGEKYFITFIKDFSRYGYIYLLHEESQSMDALEIFINNVERQLDRKVKIVKSNRNSEYYERYTENRQCRSLFVKFLKKRCICAQYTMPSTLEQNGVAKRHNRSLKGIVRVILSYSSLPLSMWMQALKTAIYLLNKVPNNAVSKTPFELWM